MKVSRTELFVKGWKEIQKKKAQIGSLCLPVGTHVHFKLGEEKQRFGSVS